MVTAPVQMPEDSTHAVIHVEKKSQKNSDLVVARPRVDVLLHLISLISVSVHAIV